MPVDRNAAAAEAIRRGLITPQQAQSMGFGRAATTAATGKLAPGGPVMQDTKTDQDALNQARDQAATSLKNAKAAQRFVQINRDEATGGIKSAPVIPLPFFDEMKWGDINPTGDPKWNAMKSISASVAPGMRPVGSGASSDKDMKLFMQSFPNVANVGPTNQMIAERLREQSDRDNAYAAFRERWYARNGTLMGADPAFNEFWKNYSAKQNYGTTGPQRSPVANAPRKPAASGWKVID